MQLLLLRELQKLELLPKDRCQDCCIHTVIVLDMFNQFKEENNEVAFFTTSA